MDQGGSMSKKKIFISGVAGFLGCHIASSLIKDGHHVVGCDNLIGGYLDNVPEGVEFYQYDCNFLNSMIKITKNVDVIYHCAATAYEGLSVFSPFVVTKNIVSASVSLMTAAIVNNVERFIFCSSMASTFLLMHLAAASLGLSSQWYSAAGSPAVEQEIRNVIGIPDDLKIYDLMVLGYPAVPPVPKDVRTVKDMLHYNACGKDDFRSKEQVEKEAAITKAWCLSAH